MFITTACVAHTNLNQISENARYGLHPFFRATFYPVEDATLLQEQDIDIIACIYFDAKSITCIPGSKFVATALPLQCR